MAALLSLRRRSGSRGRRRRLCVLSVGGQAAVAANAVSQPCLGKAVVKMRMGKVRARALLLAKAPLAWLFLPSSER